MATARKLTPKIPGEPFLNPDTTERTDQVDHAPETAAATDKTADPDLQPTNEAPSAVSEQAATRRHGDLPDASEIDPRAINRPVLTQQGYVVPGV